MIMPRAVENGSPGAKKRFIAAFNKFSSKTDDAGKLTAMALEEVEKEYYVCSNKNIYLPRKTLVPLKKRYESIDELPLDVKRLPSDDYKVMWMIQYNNASAEKKEKGVAKNIAWSAVKRFIFFNTTTCKWVVKKRKTGLADAFHKALKRRMMGSNSIIKGEKNMDPVTVSCDEKFEFFVDIQKQEDSGELNIVDESGALCKSLKDLDPDKNYYIYGEASNTSIDKENDEVSEAFLNKMFKTAVGLTAYKEHKKNIDNAIGVIDKAEKKGNSLFTRIHLINPTENEIVKDIFAKMKHGIKLGFSIGGRITKVEFYFNEKKKVQVRKLMDGILDEVSATLRPAGAVSFAQAIVKSLDAVKIEGSDDLVAKAQKEGIDSIIDELMEKDIDGEMKAVVSLYKSLDSIQQLNEYDALTRQISEGYWGFRDLINKFMHDKTMKADERKKKISAVTKEFSVIVGTAIKNLVGNALLMSNSQAQGK